MVTSKFFRHGDVKIEKIAALPRGTRRIVSDRIVARGESTGHVHIITGGDAEVLEIEGDLYLTVGESGIAITHKEHGQLEIPVGIYKIGLDREYDYSAAAVRKVVD